MTDGADMSAMPGAGHGGRRNRLALVLALVLGLFASLIHCGNCDLALAGSSPAAVAMSFDGATPPDAPDHKATAHSGHCLNHITAQPTFVVYLPADAHHQAPRIGREQTLASLAGLPLFKPPRA